MWMVHNLSLSQQAMRRLSPSVTRKEYEEVLEMVHYLNRRYEETMRLLQNVKNGRDSCPIRQIQHNTLLSVVQRHEHILDLLHKEYEPAGRGFWSAVDRPERRYGRLIVVRLTDHALAVCTLGPIAFVGFCYLAGIKTPKMLLDEKLKELPEKVDVMQSQLDKLKEIPERVNMLLNEKLAKIPEMVNLLLNEKLAKIPEMVNVLLDEKLAKMDDKLEKISRRVDVLPDEKSTKIPESVDVVQSRLDKVEEQVSRLLKQAKVVPLSSPVIAAPKSPLHAFARNIMDRVKANSEFLSASRWDP